MTEADGQSPLPQGEGQGPLGFASLLTLGINGVVGVGIFFAPSPLAQLLPGPASALAFLVTAALLLPVAWTYGRLGSAYAEDGGPYVWARAAFGESLALGVGFISYASAVLSTSAVVSGLGQYLAPELGFHGPQARLAFQVCAAAAFAAIALLGLRLSAWVWSALAVLTVIAAPGQRCGRPGPGVRLCGARARRANSGFFTARLVASIREESSTDCSPQAPAFRPVGIAFGMFAMTPRYLSVLGTPRLLGTPGWRSEGGRCRGEPF